MGIVKMCGFEWGTLAEAGFAVSKPTSIVTNSRSRSGSYAVKMKYGTGNLDFDSTLSCGIPAGAEYFLQYAIFPESLNNQSTKPVFKWLRSGSTVGGLKLDTSTGRLDVFTGNFASLVGSSSDYVTANAWTLIELRLRLDASNGVIALKVNGVLQFTYTGNTAAVAALMDQFVWAGAYAYGDVWWYYDDIVINNPSGSYNNSYPNGMKIVLLKPNADGGTNQWTVSGGSDHYAVVDEVPPSTSDYLTANTEDKVEAFGLEDLPADAQAVHAVRLDAWAQRGSTVAPTKVSLGVNTNSVDYYNTAQELPFVNALTSNVLDTNPAGGAWSKTDVDAMKLLVKSAA